MSTLHQGAVAPTSYRMTVTPGDSGLNLSTVTAVSFKVSKSDGVILTWATTITAQSSSSLTAQYNFTSTTPLDIPGAYKVYALLTIPGGFARSATATLTVKEEYVA